MDKKLSLDIETLQLALHDGIYLMTSDEMVSDQANFQASYSDDDPSKHTDFTAHPYWIHADGGDHSPEGFDSLEEIVQEMHEYIDMDILSEEDEDEGYAINVYNAQGAMDGVFRSTITECKAWLQDTWSDPENLRAEICDAHTHQVIYIKPIGNKTFKSC